MEFLADSELINQVQGSANYTIVPVDAAVVQAAVGIDDVPELHDRIIVATARCLGVPILSGDEAIAASEHVEAIW